jgi:putative hydrolase of the HAD superfamily
MTSLSPGSADALLFDLGRVVLDIDFSKAIACWAAHAGCRPEAIVSRYVRDEAYRLHEVGRISDADYFQSLRTSLGIGISDAQFLEGWNAIFAGEMPDIAELLPRAAQQLPVYAFSNTNRPVLEHRPAQTGCGSLRPCRRSDGHTGEPDRVLR